MHRSVIELIKFYMVITISLQNYSINKLQSFQSLIINLIILEPLFEEVQNSNS